MAFVILPVFPVVFWMVNGAIIKMIEKPARV